MIASCRSTCIRCFYAKETKGFALAICTIALVIASIMLHSAIWKRIPSSCTWMKKPVEVLRVEGLSGIVGSLGSMEILLLIFLYPKQKMQQVNEVPKDETQVNITPEKDEIPHGDEAEEAGELNLDRVYLLKENIKTLKGSNITHLSLRYASFEDPNSLLMIVPTMKKLRFLDLTGAKGISLDQATIDGLLAKNPNLEILPKQRPEVNFMAEFAAREDKLD